jgi:hypothetical protein
MPTSVAFTNIGPHEVTWGTTASTGKPMASIRFRPDRPTKPSNRQRQAAADRHGEAEG